MKKMMAIILCLALCFSLASCKGAAEREYEKAAKAADEAERAAKNAAREYDDLKNGLDSIESKSNALFP